MPHLPTGARPGASPASASSLRTARGIAAGTDDFAGLGVIPELVAVLASQGVVRPFPIQSATLPDSLRGRDVLGRGRTGSGKTLAFALPLVARLSASGRRSGARRPRGLVLVPTRELATQVRAVLDPLAAAAGLSTTVVFGGVRQHAQVNALRRGADIVVACPGRLEDLVRQQHCDLGSVEVTVLDEADHMADVGFLPGVRRLLDQTPTGGQRLLFSATLDNGVDVLVRRFLDHPVTHAVDTEWAPPVAMEHHVLQVSHEDKAGVVRELASGQGRALLFTRTKHAARKLARQLSAAGIASADLHGNLAQNARERNLAAFARGDVRVLVATDIAARGVHVDDIALVVHVDPPAEHKAYLHRSGRTARAGAGGVVVTVMTPAQQGDVAALVRRASIRPRRATVRPGSSEVAALTGPFAAPRHVAPARSETPAAARPTRPHRSNAPAGRASRPHRGRRGRNPVR